MILNCKKLTIVTPDGDEYTMPISSFELKTEREEFEPVSTPPLDIVMHFATTEPNAAPPVAHGAKQCSN